MDFCVSAFLILSVNAVKCFLLRSLMTFVGSVICGISLPPRETKVIYIFVP